MREQSTNRYGTAFFVASVAVVAWQCFAVALDIHLGGLSQIFKNWHVAAISIANALLFLSPYWLLPRRWRWTVWIPLTLLTVWLLMQVCYCRAYDDLMPWRSLTMTGNVNSTLAASTMALLRWQDLLIVLPWMALLIHWKNRQESQNRFKSFGVTIVIGALIGLLGYADGDTDLERRFLHNFGNRTYFSRNGLIPYTVFTLYETVKTPEVSDQERASVQRFLDEECPRYDDNAYAVRPNRNLVLIIVESLHSWPIGMTIGGREVTPNLNRLVAGDSVIYVPHMLFQTSHGHSSDAHFIYNTGLLPLRDGAVAVTNGDGPYPSLSEALAGYDCREIICTPGVNWNQTVTARTYGFDTLYTRDHLQAAGFLTRKSDIDDAALTAFATRLLPELRQPFFLEMVTMTMHAPYPPDKVPVSWITASGTLTSEARSYLNCVHVTDSCIGAFMDDLRQLSLDGNTVVVIVSDHTQVYRNRVEGRPDSQFVPDDWGIPMIITGAATAMRDESVVGQVDVFPTILDVMGANNYPWKGLGYSLLRYPVRSAVQPRNMSVIGDSTDLTLHQLRAWDISRIIIHDRSQAVWNKQR